MRVMYRFLSEATGLTEEQVEMECGECLSSQPLPPAPPCTRPCVYCVVSWLGRSATRLPTSHCRCIDRPPNNTPGLQTATTS